MFVENGLSPKLKVSNSETGITELEHKLPYRQPGNPDGIRSLYSRARASPLREPICFRLRAGLSGGIRQGL